MCLAIVLKTPETKIHTKKMKETSYLRSSIVEFENNIFWTDKTRQDKTRQDKTRQDETRRDETRRDETRRDETRQDKTNKCFILP